MQVSNQVRPGTGEGYVEWTEANIHDPYDADYFLTITKTFAPTYTFTVSCYDYSQMPQPNGIPFSDIPIDSGLTHSYTVTLGTIAHAPYEVTGGFAGSANERAEIDRLLSYVNVSENVTALPAGTDRFNLILIYGGLAKPNTFSATLNDEDASDLFTPVDGGYEIVPITLQSGENLLVLSVAGYTPYGAAADTDSLLFVVE